MEFVARQDAAVAAACVGVPPARIDAVQRQLRVTLPSNYVDFLKTMGESSGGLRVFGPTHIHRFASLIAQLPSSDYPTDRYFKVAFEADAGAVAFADVYLDLTRSNGYDAPLVTFELPLEADSEIEEEPLDFTEKVIQQLFWLLDVARTEFGAKVLVFAQDASRNVVTTKREATAGLLEHGCVASLPDSPRVACLTRDQAKALISVSEDLDLLTFALGGNSLESLDALVQDLLAVVPDATLREPPAPRTEPGT
jgi:hypothetical protein